jgi:predicted PurR-regulated permease PerM
MFFVMYYLFTEKETIMAELKKILPLSAKHQNKLFKQIQDVTHATINGQIILGIIQGVLGAITMILLGVPYAILWGFLMIITSIIPVLGSFAIWIPVAIWLYITGAVTQAIILVIIGSTLIAQSDNLLRPYIVSARADIHPATVIVGVFGGLYAFGLAGFIIGPLVLALLLTVLRFYSEELTDVKA